MFKKLFISSIVITMGLSGCAATPQPVEIDQPGADLTAPPSSDDHMGCQEGEISVDGTCQVIDGEDALINVFAKDVSSLVESTEVNEGDLKGYFVKPDDDNIYPGVVMIHEWWGLNDNIRQMADLLANEGYSVFAIDLYGGEVAEDSDQARILATATRENPEEAVAKMKLATTYLRDTGSTQLASLGWCFGGGFSLQLSLNDEIDATVMYYGTVVEDKEQLANLNGPLLGIFGAEDQGIPMDGVNKFKAALDEVGIKNEIQIYPGVGHAFANPSGSNYSAKEAKDAWKRTLRFLDQSLASKDMAATKHLPDKVSANPNAVAANTDITTFDLVGVNFTYQMDGEEAPELRVPLGAIVKINFTSEQGYHDWVVEELRLHTEHIKDGEYTTLEFVADKAGEYEYYCSIGQHRANGMWGKLIVE